jgi:type II secretory ATPase GspE/PulE/Tfp pilus assembly ATPase PilB-like protein
MKKKIKMHLDIRSPQGLDQHVTLEPKSRARYLLGHKVSGNAKGAEIQVADENVAQKHCEIKWLQRKGWVLNSFVPENKTFLNGEPVTKQEIIKNDSAILIGGTRILVTVGEKKSAETTSKPLENSGAPENSDDTFVVNDQYQTIAQLSDGLNIRLEIQTADGQSDNVILTAKDNAEYIVGREISRRNEGMDIVIPDKHISRRHCMIVWHKKNGWSVLDLDTTNGTFLNDEMVTERTPLENGNKLLLATTTAIVHIGPSSGDKGARILSVGSTANDARELGADHTQSETTATEMIDQTLMLTAEHQAIDVNDEDGDLTEAATALISPELSDELVPQLDTITATIKKSEDTVVDLNEGKEIGGTKSNVEKIPADMLPASDIEVDLQDIVCGPEHLLGITQELVDSNLLDAPLAQRLINIAKDNGQTIFRALADNEEVRFKAEIYDKVSASLNLPLIIEEKGLEREQVYVDWIPASVSEELGFLALEPRIDSTFRYATIDPYDIRLDDWIQRHVPDSIDKVLTTPDAFYPVVNRLKIRVSEEDAGDIGFAINITSDQERFLQSNIADVDIPQTVSYFIHRGFVQGASDVHIEPTEEALLARNRIDGVLHEDSNLPASLHSEIVSRIKIMSGMDVAEKRRPQDGRIGLVIRGTPIDVRVSTYPTVYGEKVVMRLLDKSALRPSPETLGLLANELRILKDKIKAPYGLIMISGPTGSGKTTTLYSCLGSIDKNAKNVLTIEDPVEYRLKGVHQMQVNEKIGLTFASGLRTMLRQDPDVIMIGECRDLDTAAMAIQASLTGHIVFSTIHTNDSIGVITRLLDMKIDPFLVASSLSLAVAQRLVRRVCKHCSTNVAGSQLLDELYKDGISDERLTSLRIEIDPDMIYVSGAGCIHCNNTGYLGRQAVFEVFEMTSSARTMIMSTNFSAEELRELAIEAGMISVVNHGLHLVDEGITTHQEVLRVLSESA